MFLHGALRDSSVLFHWVDALKDMADTVLLDLLGHGESSPVVPATVEALAASVHAALAAIIPGRNALLVGESLGGLVALAVGARGDATPVRAVFAADPPITTAKLWQIAVTFVGEMAQNPPGSFVWSLAREVFGITPAGIEERIHYPIVGAVGVPAVIATGDVSLLPPRELDRAACLVDQVDRFVIKELYGEAIQIKQIPNCGHLLLIDAVGPCLEVIRSLLERFVGGLESHSARMQ